MASTNPTRVQCISTDWLCHAACHTAVDDRATDWFVFVKIALEKRQAWLLSRSVILATAGLLVAILFNWLSYCTSLYEYCQNSV